MKQIIFVIFVWNCLLYGLDNDFDGVDDKIDQCPNSSFEYIVNSVGCIDDEIYFGSLSLEFTLQMNQDNDKILSSQFDYNYNNYLFTVYYDKNFQSTALGYKYYNIKIYTGINNVNKFIDFSYESYNDNFVYLFDLSSFFDDNNYLSYSIGSRYKHFEINYINSGTISKQINKYQDIDFSYSFDLVNYYSKIGFIQNINNRDNYSVYVSIGVDFE